jgi:uncharacterized protein
MLPSATNSKRLCLSCGLCCDGTLFKDVQLQPSDDAARLKGIGLPLSVSHSTSSLKFAQPCPALGVDCRCRIYRDRPGYCRQFECGLFKAVANRDLELSDGLRLVRTARRGAAKVRLLLHKLGDDDGHLPLSRRFQRTQRRVESAAVSAADAGLFGQLTVAVHKLNVLLSAEFYPGRRE